MQAGYWIADEIRREGPISFARFMELALYDAHHGYYRRAQGPFGMHGDFYTPAQLQPVMSRFVRQLIRHELKTDTATPLPLLDWGAGRGEMRAAFTPQEYVALEYAEVPPTEWRGAIIAQEVFDAQPVALYESDGHQWRERLVTLSADGHFCFCDGDEWKTAEAPASWPDAGMQKKFERSTTLEALLGQMNDVLRCGCLILIDYGYEESEAARLPDGTLMRYRKHHADDALLQDAGDADLTAHVNFTALRREAERLGLRESRYQTLRRCLLELNEQQQFAPLMESASEVDKQRLEQQLRTLLMTMGETFHVLVLHRDA
jgi:SAM-dependent MidA family methyltransferase